MDRVFPALTVVVPGERWETVRTTLTHLEAQTARDRIEVLVLAPSVEALGSDGDPLFDAARVVEIGEIHSIGQVVLAGVRHSTAPLVAVAEQHSYPEPQWAEALIRAHETWDAVGYGMTAANPESLIGWADMLIAFGPWVEPERPTECEALPSHNTSYRKDMLLELGDGLETLLETERLLHWELRARGYRLFLEPAARTHHLNVSRVRSWLRVRLLSARVFAGDRARSWSTPRRLVYALGSPLIPLVRLARMRADLRRVSAHHKLVPRVIPAVLGGLMVEAAGEFLGYARGLRGVAKPIDVELDRARHVR